jgi:hypothetical protein
MGHTKAENLADISSELREIGNLESIKERSPGIFYLKSIPFLHFHDKDGKRWADLKTPAGWKRLPLDFAASAASRRRFLSRVKSASAMLKAKGARQTRTAKAPVRQ